MVLACSWLFSLQSMPAGREMLKHTQSLKERQHHQTITYSTCKGVTKQCTDHLSSCSSGVPPSALPAASSLSSSPASCPMDHPAGHARHDACPSLCRTSRPAVASWYELPAFCTPALPGWALQRTVASTKGSVFSIAEQILVAKIWAGQAGLRTAGKGFSTAGQGFSTAGKGFSTAGQGFSTAGFSTLPKFTNGLALVAGTGAAQVGWARQTWARQT